LPLDPFSWGFQFTAHERSYRSQPDTESLFLERTGSTEILFLPIQVSHNAYDIKTLVSGAHLFWDIYLPYSSSLLFKMAQTDGTWPNTLLRSLSYKAFFYWKNEMQKLPLHARKKNSLILMFVRTFVSNVAYQTSGYQIPVLQASQKECFYCSTTLNSQAAGKYNELIEVV
jgi:hypothetical protein